MELQELSDELNRILAEGRPGRALIKGHFDTGRRVADNPVWVFELEVNPEGGEPYLLNHHEVVSAAAVGSYPEGSSLPCRIDSDDPGRIAFGDRPFM